MNTYFDSKYAIADQVIIAYNGNEEHEILLTDSMIANQVGKGAFLGNKKIKTLVIPEGYKEIGERAFKGCNTLSIVSLPSTLEFCAKDAFLQCPELRELYAVRVMEKDEYDVLLSTSIHLPTGEMLLTTPHDEIMSLYELYVGLEEFARPVPKISPGMGAIFSERRTNRGETIASTEACCFQWLMEQFPRNMEELLYQKEMRMIEEPFDESAERTNDQYIRLEKDFPVKEVLLVTFDPSKTKVIGDKYYVTFHIMREYFYWFARRMVKHEGKSYYVCIREYMNDDPECIYFSQFERVVNERFVHTDHKTREAVYGKFILLSML